METRQIQSGHKLIWLPPALRKKLCYLVLQLIKSLAQRHNGMESQLEIYFPQNGTSSNPVFIIKKHTPIFHLFRLKMVLRDKFPPIRLQIRMRWICFGHFIGKKNLRHSQGQLRIFSRFPTASVSTTTSDAFG